MFSHESEINFKQTKKMKRKSKTNIRMRKKEDARIVRYEYETLS